MNSVGDAVIRIGPALAIVVVILAILAVVINRAGRTGHTREVIVATVRATVQLAALAAVLGLVIQRAWAWAIFVVVMGCAAAWTSAGRITGRRASLRGSVYCLLPVALATIVIVATMVVIGVLPASGLAVIPTAGIMFGGAMNTASLAGRRAHDELRTRAGEVDAALSLGLLPRDARLEICREPAATALIPGIDQTRSVGLVTIPGAFVGMVLGGASTTAAAVMQLFVLISLLAVSSIAVVVTTEMVGRDVL
ncbi:ABC transporter permease [Gordonia sp. CPCC 206044]|uniref:ABC transporter permease n=1 Tax=Gordonia sp. CPCC 206044 TaxID=3140793 RepID=UPI003AF38E8C